MVNIEYTRDDLIGICEQAFTSESSWTNRDSATAHRQLGECYALLRAGCDFSILRGPKLTTDERTVWVKVTFKGFAHFDWGGEYDAELYYLPTLDRLATAGSGRDWY